MATNKLSVETVPKKSFAQIARATQCPKKDQGLVFSFMSGTQILDYIVGVGNIIGPKHIIFSSRLSNDRICLFLSCKEVVEKFLYDQKGITINGKFLTGRKLLSSSKRIIISNAPPFIPNEIIEEALLYHKLKLLSPVNYLRVGIKVPGYEHILGTKRHVFIDSDLSPTIPSNFTINFDDTDYKIYLGEDIPTNRSVSSRTIPQNEGTPLIPIPAATGIVQTSALKDPSLPAATLARDNIPSCGRSGTQREDDGNNPSHEGSQDSEETSSTLSIGSLDSSIAATPTSRQKQEESKNKVLSSISKTIGTSDLSKSFPNTRLLAFIEETYGNNNVPELLKNYSSDLKHLKTLLSRIHLLSKDKSVKNRITRILNKIEIMPSSPKN